MRHLQHNSTVKIILEQLTDTRDGALALTRSFAPLKNMSQKYFLKNKLTL